MTELALPWGLAPDGRLVRVATVPSGKACDVVCPGCGGGLVAKKGGIIRHHFAHLAEAGCGGGALESTLHRLGKQLVADNCGLHLPEVVAEVEHWRKPLAKPQAFEAERSEIEAALGPYRCDVMLWAGGYRLAVEITVTHPCTPEKIEAFRAAGVDAVELDLSRLRWDDLGPGAGKLVLRDAPRRWLHNARAEAERASMAAYIARKRAEEAREQARLADEARRVRAEREARHAWHATNAQWLATYGLMLEDRSEPQWMVADRRGSMWRNNLRAAAWFWLGADAAAAWLSTPPPGLPHSVESQPAWPSRQEVQALWVQLYLARPDKEQERAA